MKRYEMYFEDPKYTAYTYAENSPLSVHDRFYGHANSMMTCRRYIKEVKEYKPDAHNFRIFDTTLDHPYLNPVYTEE